MKLRALCLLLVPAVAACGSVEYKDTTAQVDANPLCVSASDQPNEPVSENCRREQSATWGSGRKGAPMDFGDKDDDRPRGGAPL